MKVILGVALSVAALGLLACGGEEVSEDQIVEGLDVRYEGADYLYESSEGTCIITDFLTSSDDVKNADTGDASVAVASNDEGTFGVLFGGTTSVAPDDCAASAVEDLNAMETG